MAWYMQLSGEQQAALQGLVVMALFALVKAIAHWAGKPLSQSAGAKATKVLAVIIATSLTTLATTGATPAFWPQWAGALVTAIGSWEIISKTYGLGASAPPANTPGG